MQGPPYQPPPYKPPQPYQPQYQPPQPPPKTGLSTGAIVAIVIAAAFGLLVVGTFVLGAMAGVARYLELSRDGGAAAAADPLTVALDQSYTTPNKLLTAHYPGSLVAKTLDDATLIVSRNFGGGEDEVVTLAAVQSPITNDPKELARILLGLVDKNVKEKGGTSAKTSERAGTCLGKYPGVEVEGTFTVPPTAPYPDQGVLLHPRRSRLRAALRRARARAATEGPLLDRIMNATGDRAPRGRETGRARCPASHGREADPGEGRVRVRLAGQVAPP